MADRTGGRTTVLEPVETTGVGLHTGKPVRMRLLPAEPDSGVVFRLVAGPVCRDVPATLDRVVDARNATTLAEGDARVGTVEHVLAAISMQRIDDVVVELDAAEPPAVDGSAAPFVRMLAEAGRRSHGGARREAEIVETVMVRDGAREIAIEPAEAFAVDYEIDFEAAAIGRQRLVLAPLDGAAFRAQVASARTFGFLADVERLRASGLAGGASLTNTVVIDGDRVLNDEGLRFADECVRHKVLDLVGDLALFGVPLRGRVRARRGGHALHHALLHALRDRTQAWRFIDGQSTTGDPPA